MKQWIDDLLLLQENDMRVRSLETRLNMIPKEQNSLKENTERERAELKQAKEASQKSELDLKRIESEIDKINEEILRLQSQSAMIKKNDEYQAMTKEINSCHSKIGDLETKQINCLDVIEEHKEEYNKLEKSFKEREKSTMDECSELDEVKLEIDSEIQKTKNLRAELQLKLEPNIINIYSRLLHAKGKPMTAIHKGNCGNCHLKVTPQTLTIAKKGDMAMCDNCSHLLYISES